MFINILWPGVPKGIAAQTKGRRPGGLGYFRTGEKRGLRGQIW